MGATDIIHANATRRLVVIGIIMAWDRWHVKIGTRKPVLYQIICGMGVAVLSICANFNVNRFSMLVPTIIFVAVWSAKIKRIPLTLIASFGLIILCTGLIFGSYRGSDHTYSDFANSRIGVSELVDAKKMAASVQATLLGPQYIAYGLYMKETGHIYFWGRSLVACIMDPVPLLNKFVSYAGTAGNYIYNDDIHGNLHTADQPLPIYTELIWNFGHLGGLIIFLTLGGIIALLQRAHERLQRDSFIVVYSFTMIAFCFIYVISYNIAAAVQILTCLTVPAYFILAIWWFRLRFYHPKM
jgi:hypothetical protein